MQLYSKIEGNNISNPVKLLRLLKNTLNPEKLSESELNQKNIYVYNPPEFDSLTHKTGNLIYDTENNYVTREIVARDFDIQVEMSEVNVGPTVTQYTLKPAQGVKLSKIEARTKDLALALARHPIRIEAPIRGRSLVGVEVPNEVRARVRLKGLLSRDEFEKNPLNLALGKDVSGDP